MHTAIDKAKSEQQNIGAGSFTIESASDALVRVRECIERALAERDHAIADALNVLDEVQQELVRQCEQAVSRPAPTAQPERNGGPATVYAVCR